MKLTVMYRDKLFNMEVTEDMEVMNFKALCGSEVGLPENSSGMKLICNGQVLQDSARTLKHYRVSDGDVLLMEVVPSGVLTSGSSRSRGSARAQPMGIDFSSINIPTSAIGTNNGSGTSSGSGSGASFIQSSPGGYPEDPRAIFELLRESPHERAIIREHNPPLSAALESGDCEKFTKVLTEQRKERAEKERERIALLNADPFDASVQQRIAEEIRLKNVDSNMETAMEYSPESFGQVVMLYIDCMVNGHEVKAFVDSGAQMTIMSQACAERCNIMRLVDKRWAGIAKGVGVQKIIGRVHLGQIQIGNDFLQSSFSILEEQPMDMLLGLDMLKRHQCVIDLKNNELVIGTTGTRTGFLPEGDLPEHARLNRPPSTSDDAVLAETMAKSAAEASQAAASVSDQPASSQAPAADVTEEHIRSIMLSGFSRNQAVTELNKSNGDVNKALATLLASSFSSVKR